MLLKLHAKLAPVWVLIRNFDLMREIEPKVWRGHPSLVIALSQDYGIYIRTYIHTYIHTYTLFRDVMTFDSTWTTLSLPLSP